VDAYLSVTQAYEECTYIQQAFVYGDSGKICLVAVVVPKMEAVASFLGKEEVTQEEFVDACKADGLRKAVLNAMNVVGKVKGLFGPRWRRRFR
jgi:long-subunit acyl-CoA synthetase (AMP-forming)